MATNWTALGLPESAEEREEHYRTAILDAAEVEFGLAGYSAAKTQLIARRADCSPSTLYRLFHGKTDLWNTLHRERMAALVGTIDAATRDVTEPLDVLLSGTRAVVAFFAEHTGFLELQLANGLSWATADHQRLGRDQQGHIWSEGRRTLAAAVAAAQRSGDLVDQPTTLVTRLFMTTLQVHLVDWVDRQRPEPVEVLAENTVASLLRVVGTTRPQAA